MKQLHLITTFSLILGSPCLFANWQVGAMAGAEYNSSTQETSPVVLPWLAYQSQHWSFNPTSATYLQQFGIAQWRLGMVFDHSAWQEDWTRVFGANTGLTAFLGPIRIDNSATVNLGQRQNWSSRHTAGTMLPLGKVFLAIESGVLYEQTTELTAGETTWVNGLQLMAAKDNWRFMAMSALDRNLQTRQNTAAGMLSVLYEW